MTGGATGWVSGRGVARGGISHTWVSSRKYFDGGEYRGSQGEPRDGEKS